jgi:hypothetical protein
MNSENYSEQPVLPEDESIQEDTPVLPITRKLRYKTVLIALVIGIIAITVLLIIRQVENPSTDPLITELDSQTQDEYEVNGSNDKQQGETYGTVDFSLHSLADSIEQGFQARKEDSSIVKSELADIDKDLQGIKVALSDLGENNKEFRQLMSDTASRLDTITNQVKTLKVAKRKPKTKSKSRPAKVPPFKVDAIDVWDDKTYVVVSQAGHVAFLQAGERQSGWTLTHINRLKGQARFKGPSGQIHSVELQR